ncbi:MAG: undecaprenyldiphospho-muramoylpentapeptide beta-N-acetylglucosaminyltransferase [Cyanobacteria bacterium P01_A01_bin.105]
MDDGQKQTESVKLLIAASGTGGHLFPAVATANALNQTGQWTIEWLGVPNRLETQLVPQQYSLNTVQMGGVQGRLGLGSIKLLNQFLRATTQVRRLLKQGDFQGVFTTGGYIAAPAILAARSLGLPAVLHESNALPGKVTRWLSPWCTLVALGFEEAEKYLPKAKTVTVGTPVRSEFVSAAQADLRAVLDQAEIPEGAPVIVVVGGSQGAVAVNRLVRAAAPAWLAQGAWIIHQTGTNDPAVDSLSHPQYIHRPFFDNVAALFKRATLVISRAGAGSLTELAMTHTPSILIPYPFAAEDHQAYNAAAFASVGAAKVYRQSELTSEELCDRVLTLLSTPEQLAVMSKAASHLAVEDSAEKLANLLRQAV